MANAKDSKQEIYVTYMDTSKAFDIVDHKGMLNALHQQSIHDSLWQTYDSMYSGIQSAVKWQGEMSHSFGEQQGIRQGGSSSSDCYKAGKNKLLRQLDATSSQKIGNLNAGAIMVADELAIVASSMVPMQISLTMAETDAKCERYTYNASKTKTVAINCSTAPILKLNDKPLGTSSKEVHVGIHRNDTTLMPTLLKRE